MALGVAGRAESSAVVHDTDVSRALPWDRRPQASRLLTDMANPNRGWDGNAVQYQTVAAAMEYHGVSLWVPKVGGQVDFTSEAHDIVLNIFGTMSKGERTRLKKRAGRRHRHTTPTGLRSTRPRDRVPPQRERRPRLDHTPHKCWGKAWCRRTERWLYPNNPSDHVLVGSGVTSRRNPQLSHEMFERGRIRGAPESYPVERTFSGRNAR